MPATVFLAMALQAAAPAPQTLSVYRWYPSSGKPWKTAIGVAGGRKFRHIAMLQIGLPGSMPRQLTSFSVNCDSGKIDGATFATVDASLTRTLPMTGPAFSMMDGGIQTSDGAPLTVHGFGGIIGDVLEFGCDDGRLAQTYQVPLSKVNDDASYRDEQG